MDTQKNQSGSSSSYKTSIRNLILCLSGSAIYCLGFNLFIVPANLYSGGFIGISQLLSDMVGGAAKFSFNLQPLLYLLLNIPLFLVAFRVLGHRLIRRSVMLVCAETLFLWLIPVPAEPILDETLACVICGGCIEGLGIAITFRGFGSSGGTDMLGLILTQRYPGFSVGRVNLAVNLVVYSVAGIRYSLKTAIYSLAGELFCSLMVDRYHKQNNLVSVNIVSPGYREIADYIMGELNRSCTILEGTGGYSKETKKLLIAIISEYELDFLKKEVNRIDPNAFLFIHPNIDVMGDFEKRLS